MKATESLASLQALTIVGKFVNFHRITYREGDWHTVFPSTLVVIEAPSGSGKNAIYNFYQSTVFKMAFENLEITLKKETERLVGEEEKRLESRLEEEGIGKSEQERAKLAIKYQKYLERFQRDLRDPVLDHWDDGTYEGFAKQRAFMAKLSVGSKTIRSNEFGDRLKQMKNNTHLVSMFARFFELVDDDKLGAKYIKDKEGTTEGSSGMATTLMLTYAPMDRTSRDQMKGQISQSLGRRGFLLRETNESIRFHSRPPYDASLTDELTFEVNNLVDVLERYVGKEISFTDEAKDWIYRYTSDYRVAMNSIYTKRAPSERKDLDLCILQDKDRKVVRVAVLLAIFNHAEEDFAVTVLDLEEAKVLVEQYVEDARAFFDMSDYSDTNAVLAYLSDRGEEWASARTLFEAGLFKDVRRDNFQTGIREVMLRDIQVSAHSKGLKVVLSEKNKQDLYRVEPYTDEDRAKELLTHLTYDV